MGYVKVYSLVVYLMAIPICVNGRAHGKSQTMDNGQLSDYFSEMSRFMSTVMVYCKLNCKLCPSSSTMERCQLSLSVPTFFTMAEF